MKLQHIKLIKSIILEKGEIDLVTLKEVLKLILPSISDDEQDKIIQNLLVEGVICEISNNFFTVCDKESDIFESKFNSKSDEEISKTKEVPIEINTKKINSRKGFLRIHILLSLVLLPVFSIIYYATFKTEVSQNIHLKNGAKLKVYPYIQSNANVDSDEALYNPVNSKFYPSGYDFRLDSTSKWNQLITFLSLNKFPGPSISETHKGINQYTIYTKKYDLPEIILSKNDKQWKFNSMTGILKYDDYFSINLKNDKLIDKSNYIETWPKRPLFSDTNGLTYTIYKHESYNFYGLKLLVFNDSLKQTIPHLNNQAPFFYNDFPYDFDPRRFDEFYEGYIFYKLFHLNYFIEPPFLDKIQFIFSTKKHFLTTTHYFGFVFVIIILYWFVYFILLHTLKWIKNGFN
jgi:hypothetical protein